MARDTTVKQLTLPGVDMRQVCPGCKKPATLLGQVYPGKGNWLCRECIEFIRWAAYRWQAHGGLGNLAGGRGRVNKAREVIWFSPSCIKPSSSTTQKSLFDLEGAD